ncbi:hypothetical protein F5X96DRAFT_694161 [Biscogniauxia mediterranea]|nr:hypothetical protein F5X96DRAFT_694161 [Biscogniauxia mediterranea]
MAVSGAAQALIAAFSFGILFTAASATSVIYIKGNGSAIFRDGLRLVLILFLISSTSWAFVEFLSVLIEPTAITICQTAVVFSSIFDQLGRVFVEQYLVWALQKNGEKSVLSILPQILVLGRLILGITFAALTRTGFNPTCVPVSQVQAVSITAIALDAAILFLLAIRSFGSGPAKGGQDDGQIIDRSKAVNFIVIGLAIWMGTSVTLLLGIGTFDLFFRTTLPVIGLTILVALVAVFSGTLVVTREPPRRPDSPVTQGMDRNRDLSSSDSTDYPPSRYEDIKEMDITTMSAFAAQADMRGGLPVQGQLFPPMRATQADIANLPNVSQSLGPREKRAPVDDKGKMARTNRSKGGPKGAIGKLAISNPILKDDEGTPNPLDRIPTIDLATAASNEKARRAKGARRVSDLIAKRPAPSPPSLPEPETATNRAMSVKRKNSAPKSLADLQRPESSRTTKTTGGLSVEVNASSTATQLSPGIEAVRKRSPRQPRSMPMPAATTSNFQAIRPGEPIRIPIPRPAEPSPTSPVPEPVKTPLQRRPTNGLPSNPRAQATAAIASEATSQKKQTVMFVNNIVYDDPNAVNNIVQGASKTPITALDSGDSMVHRPRPIPRKGDKDRQVFPAEISPGHSHRRSKSGNSIASRKSGILQSMAGSPTQLPPLPPPPKSAGASIRPLINDTKSMTFDEKMEILVARPSAPTTSTAAKRRSSVPDMPPVPDAFLRDGPSQANHPASDWEIDGNGRVSKITDRSTIRTASVLDDADLYQTISPSTRKIQTYNDNLNRRSSPVIPRETESVMSPTMTETAARDEDITSNWGSVHSPVVPVHIQKARQNARSTYIEKESRDVGRNVDQPGTSAEEIVTVMLDTSPEQPVNNRLSIREKYVEPAVESPVTKTSNSGQFHHRVGDECPTFSSRKDKGRSRKMPPPAPLLLNGNSIKKRAIVIQAAEPSPLESPEAAYQVIQAQLKKFEQPTRDSTGSQGQRLALLENLELEMGQLESKWQSTQNKLDRDSMSSIRTSPTGQSRPSSTVIPPRRSSQNSTSTARQPSSQAPLQSGNTIRPNRISGASMSSSQDSSLSSESTHASLWQARLAEAQMEYMDHAPDLIMKRNNMNFLSVSKADLGSPSPPDTDDSEPDNDVRRSMKTLSARPFSPPAQHHGLWKPSTPLKNSSDAWLWTAPAKQPAKHDRVVDLPGLTIRPVSRKCLDALKIESSQLWQKPGKLDGNGNGNVSNGMWKKSVSQKPALPQQINTRPVTVRPPRRSKRISLLPDIIESPKPLPDKRGTLGIFQFPWGERSEHPTIQSRPNQIPMAMPGTMTTGGPVFSAALDARARQIEASEYSASFFDEYDEEDGDNFEYYTDSEDEDDGFDETTLWEIASLLRSEVPSQDSLLLSPEDLAALNAAALAEYGADVLSDLGRDDKVPQEQEPAPEEPVPEFLPASTYNPVAPKSLLWTPQSKQNVNRQQSFLPMPEKTTWDLYVSYANNGARARPHAQEPVTLQSNSLWEPNKKISTSQDGLLWTSPESSKATLAPSVTRTNKASAGASLLWEQPQSVSAHSTYGLPQPDSTIWQSYIPEAGNVLRSQPRTEVKISSIESSSLWVSNAVDVDATNQTLLWAARKPTTSAVAVPSPANSPAKAMLLWAPPTVTSAPEVDGLFDISSLRSDYRRTSKEPAALLLSSRPSRVIEGPLAQLKTNHLWTVKASTTEISSSLKATPILSRSSVTGPVNNPSEKATSAQLGSLWVQPPRALDTEHEGLFNIGVTRSDFRRTSKDPVAISIARKPFQRSEEALPRFGSNDNLWIMRSPVPTPVSISAQLFVSSRSVSSPTRAIKTTMTEAHLSGLWKKPTNVRHLVNEGLFSVGTPRKDFKRTSEAPAAISMVTKPRVMREPLATLTTTKLWAVPTSASRTSASSKSFLWTKDDAATMTSAKLFQPDPRRVDWRTTSAEPAALTMSRKPRAKRSSVQNLESTRLWVSSQAASVEIDWISMSSIRPASPTGTSISATSSSLSSPTSDSASAKTSITKASSVPESTKGNGSFFRGWWGKKAQKQPEVPKVPENVEFDMRSEIPTELVIKNLDEVTREKITHIPLRRQYRPTMAYRQDWDSALQEAIIASYPGTMVALRATYPRNWDEALQEAIQASGKAPEITRKKATPKEWSMALQNAIAASYSEPKLSRGQVSPSQWKNELEEAIMKGKGVQATSFDVSIRHPVFFGSTTMTSGEVHPAMQGYVMERKQAPATVKASLWVKPTQVNSREPMNGWTVSNTSMPQMTISSPPVRAQSGKATAREAKIEVDAEFGKQGLWKQTLSSRSHGDRNWLDDTMKKRFTRVELRY